MLVSDKVTHESEAPAIEREQTPDTRDVIRPAWPATRAAAPPVEFKTDRPDEVMALGDEMEPQRSSGTALRLTIGADRDRPGYYFTIVEFDSYEAAMENSNRPETSKFGAKMAQQCDGPPTFRNLDVQKTWEP